MGFFETTPRPRFKQMRQDVDPEKPWVGPPDYVLPAVAPLAMVLARTDRVVVALLGVHVYFDSFGFAISVRTEPGIEVDISHAFRARYAGGSDQEQLRIGVAFSDGSRVTDLDYPFRPSEVQEPPVRVLRPMGGGGQSYRVDQEFWSWPLPSPGSLDFFCQWESQGIPMTRCNTDAAPILEAARNARRLWT
ncbi:MAG: hypothetical protein M0Z92_11495 [Actinomycetota bacterium]|nr:hypothetical protein [Actinomycetota bacterium]